jgi:hypothetical protein
MLVVRAKWKDAAASKATENADNIATLYSLALMPSRHFLSMDVMVPGPGSLVIGFGDLLHGVDHLAHLRGWRSKRHQAQSLLDYDIGRKFCSV